MSGRRRASLGWLGGVLLGLAGAVLAQSNSCPIGFSGREIFPIDQQIGQLHAADLDGDGLLDLVVVNNARSKINLLYNQTRRARSVDPVKSLVRRELNELPPDARFRIESIASEKRIASLVVADVNGDGRPDIAYYGEPKELVVIYNQGTNGWSTPKRFPIEDGVLSANSLAEGDLNGDHRRDLLLLGESGCYFLAQKADHTLAEPEKIPYSGSVKSIQILDIDGDGREDLLLVNWDGQNPFRFRLQNREGQLGPEIHFSTPPARSYLADDLSGDHRTEIVTIAQNSGRAQLSGFIQQPGERLVGNLKKGQFQVLPLNKTGKSKRGVAWVDLNGDGCPDLVVAEPDSGQLTVYMQKADGSLGASKSFPTLTGVSDIAVADWNDDGETELFLLSADERQVGVTSMDEKGRIRFPDILPLEGRPLAIAAGPLEADARPVLALIVEQDGKRFLQVRTAEGETRTQRLSDSFKSNATTMVFHDVDQDGLMDLIVLIPFEKIKILRQLSTQDFEELDLAPPGGSVDQPWMCLADVDGDGHPELLLAQKNFLRAVVLQPGPPASGVPGKANWVFQVKEQINGASSNSRIVAAAPVPDGNRRMPHLFLLDAERKALTVCGRDAAGVWQVVRNLPLPVTDFASLQAVSLGEGGATSLAFLGLNAVAWMTFKGKTWEMSELDSYETPIKDGFLNDVVSGDLKQNGTKDLVFLETAKNHLDVVLFQPPRRLVPATRWRVFEERTFRGRRAEALEPREALVADLTGDGKNDLVVVVHDRIILYPQE